MGIFDANSAFRRILPSDWVQPPLCHTGWYLTLPRVFRRNNMISYLSRVAVRALKMS